jgi:hypothetical protein
MLRSVKYNVAASLSPVEGRSITSTVWHIPLPHRFPPHHFFLRQTHLPTPPPEDPWKTPNHPPSQLSFPQSRRRSLSSRCRLHIYPDPRRPCRVYRQLRRVSVRRVSEAVQNSFSAVGVVGTGAVRVGAGQEIHDTTPGCFRSAGSVCHAWRYLGHTVV